jgi:hypothetical protein
METEKTFIIIMHYACIHVLEIKNRVEHSVPAFQKFFTGLYQGCKMSRWNTNINTDKGKIVPINDIKSYGK